MTPEDREKIEELHRRTDRWLLLLVSLAALFLTALLAIIAYNHFTCSEPPGRVSL